MSVEVKSLYVFPHVRLKSCRIICLCVLLLIAGCSSINMGELAQENGFTRQVFPCETFDLVGYMRGSGQTLHVYIEGDGKAWLSRNRPSFDPTPDRPISFLLASRSSSPAVLYLSRPCQFIDGEGRRNCITPFWTSARFSKPVVHDMGQAIDEAMRMAGATELVLVGYSGGGAIAMLLAAERTDVRLVVTVAGNLDHDFWTRLHGVSPLRDSLNPANYAHALERVRQVHIVSDADEIVPPEVAKCCLDRMSDASNAKLIILQFLGHTGEWEEVVPGILDRQNKE